MSNPKTLNGQAAHAHMPNTMLAEATERCPWCHQPVSRAEFKRIREEIAL